VRVSKRGQRDQEINSGVMDWAMLPVSAHGEMARQRTGLVPPRSSSFV
jgi:hypothetical protein